MQRPAKIVLGAAALVLAAVATIAYLAVTRLDRTVAGHVEAYLEAAAGTDATVGAVEISLADGRGTLRGLTVANPPGFETDYALEIDEIEAVLRLASLAEDVVALERVVVTGARLHAEQRGQSSNLTTILDHMEEQEEPPAAAEEGRIVIGRFSLTDGRVIVTSEALGEPETLELEPVTLEGIGDPGGATYTEATDAVLGAILAAARAAVTAGVRDAAGEAARRELEEEIRDRLDPPQ